MPYILYQSPEGAARRAELEKRPYTIGRSSKSDLTLPDLSLSRVHAEIRPREDGVWEVRDLGSKNGTFLNGQEVAAPTPLAEGDRIVVGDTELRFGPESSSKVSLTEEPLPELASDHTVILPVDEIATRDGSVRPAGAPAQASNSDVLFRANRELVEHRPQAELLDTILKLGLEASGAQRGFLMLSEGDPPELVTRATRGAGPGDDFVLSRTLARMVVEEKTAVLTADVLQDDRFASGQSILAQGIRSLMCVPLYSDQQVIGLLYVDSQSGVSPFGESDLRVLTNLANVAAVKIENTRLIEENIRRAAMEKDLQEAASIQRRFLPGANLLEVPGLEVVGMTVACREVGGDYYDLLPRPNDRFLLAVADVSGKGLPAALMMSNFQAALRARAEGRQEVQVLLGHLNDQLASYDLTNKFVSCFLAEYEPASGELHYTNGGHNAPFLVRADGTVIRLQEGGLPVGMFAGQDYQSGTARLEPGDLLALYSDGVTEAVDPQGEEFGDDRLAGLLLEGRKQSARHIVDSVDEAVSRFSRTQARGDDMTLVVAQRLL